jgi:hypothetical protein
MNVQWVTYNLGQRYRVLGTGYNQPEDIKVTSGGRYAYVTERAGNLLRVDLTNANRAAAQVVASGLTAPHQVALDEAHGQAYVPEFTGGATGNIWRVDLSGGTKTAIYTGLQGCTGLLLSGDLRYAYVAEQVSGANRVARLLPEVLLTQAEGVHAVVTEAGEEHDARDACQVRGRARREAAHLVELGGRRHT